MTHSIGTKLIAVSCVLLATVATAQESSRTNKIDAPTSNPNAIRSNATQEANEARTFHTGVNIQYTCQ